MVPFAIPKKLFSGMSTLAIWVVTLICVGKPSCMKPVAASDGTCKDRSKTLAKMLVSLVVVLRFAVGEVLHSGVGVDVTRHALEVLAVPLRPVKLFLAIPCGSFS